MQVFNYLVLAGQNNPLNRENRDMLVLVATLTVLLIIIKSIILSIPERGFSTSAYNERKYIIFSTFISITLNDSIIIYITTV